MKRKFFTMDSDMNMKKSLNYPLFFWVVAAITVVQSATIGGLMSREPRVIKVVSTVIDTVYTDDIKPNDSSITRELIKLGCVLPNVAIAQFKIETGHFKSPICIENKNVAGIKTSTSKYVVGKNKGHCVYKTYKDCLRDYVRIQNHYLSSIDGRYAEAKGYIQQLKIVK